MPRPPSFSKRPVLSLSAFLVLLAPVSAVAQTDYLALCRADDISDRLLVEACGFAGHDEKLPPEARAEALSRRGQAMAEQLKDGHGNFELRNVARVDFEEALRLAPNDTDIKRQYLTFNNHWTGKTETQLAMANAFLAGDGEDAGALLQRGLAYMRKGDNEKALADVSKAAELDPKSVDIFTTQGQILTNLMRNEESFQAFSHAIELAPSRDDIRLLRMGPALVAQHFDAVREDGDKVLAGQFAKAHLWDIRGAANYMLMDYKTATSDFTEQIKLDRLSVRSLVWRFLAQYRGGAADKDAATARAKELGDQWPAAILAFFAGQATEADIFAQIEQSPAQLRATRAAQAHLYIAEWGLLTNAPTATVKEHLIAVRDAGIAFGSAETTLMGEPAVMNDNNIIEMAIGAARLREVAP